MKEKLNHKDLKGISGGIINRGLDGSYIIAGTGLNKRFFDNQRLEAIKYDWERSEFTYRMLYNINSLEELSVFYDETGL